MAWFATMQYGGPVSDGNSHQVLWDSAGLLPGRCSITQEVFCVSSRAHSTVHNTFVGENLLPSAFLKCNTHLKLQRLFQKSLGNRITPLALLLTVLQGADLP